MCRAPDHPPIHIGLLDDDDDGNDLQTFAHYALGRTPEQQRRLWAQVGGSSDEWNANHPEEQ